MKIKVIEVAVSVGAVKAVRYVSAEPSVFANCLVEDPLQAINFLVQPRDHRSSKPYDPDVAIRNVMDSLRLPNDSWYSMSGVCVDAIFITEFDVEVTETYRAPGRNAHASAACQRT